MYGSAVVRSSCCILRKLKAVSAQQGPHVTCDDDNLICCSPATYCEIIMQITALYASLLALFFIYLSFCVIRLRRSEQVALGDGDNKLLRRAIRVHGNFAEYIPFALLLIAFAEFNGLSAWAIHILGALLLVGRVVHAIGVSKAKEDLRLRVFGMVSTFLVIIVSALCNLVLAF